MNENLYLIGNAHLDPAWLWRLEEGFEAFLATCRSALDRMKETPTFIFTCSSAACYQFVEQTDPELFRQIQDAVRAGKWEIVGGWWVEADCNIPHGESFVRQALYGQNYFESRFGKRCSVGYCIDSFGHNANLPQLLKRSGLASFVFMRPEAVELTLPGSLFRWQAPGGDEVIAYRIPYHYSNHQHSVTEKVHLLKGSGQYREELPWMIFYGVGNHGGGPTKEQIREILQAGYPMRDTSSFFEKARESATSLPMHCGELQHHAIGCYSNHSLLKAANRHTEHALLRAEKFCVLSELVTAQQISWREFDRAWENVLLNQFHDTLGGVSTVDACNDALDMYGEASSIASRQERIALQRIRNKVDTSHSIESLMVFNAQLAPYEGPIEFEIWNPDAARHPLQGLTLTDEEGERLELQRVAPDAKIGDDRIRFVALVQIPSYGWKTFRITRSSDLDTQSAFQISERSIGNSVVKFSIDEKGKNCLQYQPLAVFRDESDTWAHGVTSFVDRQGSFQIDRVSVVENGPVRVKMRINSSYNRSACEQDITLQKGSREITIDTVLDWRESHALCKMEFLHDLESPHFFSEIPYAVIERPCDGKEYPATSWSFVGNGSHGIGILSDSKSSFSCDEQTVSMVVARSALYAQHVPPHRSQVDEKLVYLDHGVQKFSTKVILGFGTHQQATMSVRSLHFHEPPVVLVESGHRGDLERESCLGTLDTWNASATAIKSAADGAGVILRIQETAGQHQKISLNFAGTTLLDMTLRPYELKTYRLNKENFIESSLLELIQA